MEKPQLPQQLFAAAVAYSDHDAACRKCRGAILCREGWRLLDAFMAIRRALESTPTAAN